MLLQLSEDLLRDLSLQIKRSGLVIALKKKTRILAHLLPCASVEGHNDLVHESDIKVPREIE
jgi:hypothetical protein